ncbi:aminotransferase class I/II-fold pyridoxal phosphate-dependent enzyme [Rhizobiaceae bacterium]|nr:aminotransferase class I/II-fold pyridoxal phosphate-dependent enzyme [Rhizobiaceae bacterium]
MTDTTRKAIPAEAMQGSLRDYRMPHGSDLLKRTAPFFKWQELRREHDLWPYARSTESAPRTRCSALTDCGKQIEGVNFASQDYLSLASHPVIKEAAMSAIKDFGVHSAGSAALLGNTANSLKLEKRIEDFIGGHEVVLYPTGWSAGFAAVQGFVRPHDHVILDVLAHSCLQEGARAATANIHFHGHLNLKGLERRLQRIRAKDTENGILVVTESLFSMHADTPDLKAMGELCKEYNANFLVDVAHDFGCIGEDGLGHLSLQNMIPDADIIIGSFSKTFASNGGFIAVKNRSDAEYLKYYSATQTFSNALSPVQAATVMAAFDIVQSQEGKERRAKLMENILYLREEVVRAGMEAHGDPSPIVPVKVGSEDLARLSAHELSQRGAIANLVEYPAVPQGGARFRVQVMADHSKENIDTLVTLMRDSMKSADLQLRTMREAGIVVESSPFNGDVRELRAAAA